MPNSTGKAANAKATTSQVRVIRTLLEQLSEADEVARSILSRINHQSDIDDIRPRIMCQASQLELWTKVEPSMFDDVLEEELDKYRQFKDQVVQLDERVDGLLRRIRVGHSFTWKVCHSLWVECTGEKSSVPRLQERRRVCEKTRKNVAEVGTRLPPVSGDTP